MTFIINNIRTNWNTVSNCCIFWCWNILNSKTFYSLFNTQRSFSKAKVPWTMKLGFFDIENFCLRTVQNFLLLFCSKCSTIVLSNCTIFDVKVAIFCMIDAYSQVPNKLSWKFGKWSLSQNMSKLLLYSTLL